MTVLLDLGTSRTGVAMLDEEEKWVRLQAPIPTPGRRPATWSELSDLIDGVSTITYVAQPSHFWVYSRFATIHDLTLPISLAGTDVVLPNGATVTPSASAGPTFSIKQSKVWAAQFLAAIRDMLAPLGGEGQQWVIGRSSGAINPIELNLPGGTKTYNEATAVMFAALAEQDMLSSGALQEGNAVMVADLGGGFLDISVANEIKHESKAVSARIVNYGGYPLGVDRVGRRFDRTDLDGADSLISLLALAINYHVWDYRRRLSTEDAPTIIVAGGGFARLESTLKSRRKVLDQLKARLFPQAKVIWADRDTKELTLSGLRLLSAKALVTCRDDGAELSVENPHEHGADVVRSSNLSIGTATSWSALLDDLRIKTFGA